MNHGLGAVCDTFHVNCRLFLRMELQLERETVLHFFDRVRKEYPGMNKLRRRNGRCVILEEDPDEQGSRRWIRLDHASLRFGCFSPRDMDDVRKYGEFILTQAPFHLTISDIDVDYLEVIYGFDLDYRGNHDQLVAETLLGDQPAANAIFGDQSRHIIDAQPYYGIALSPGCDLQAYVEIKSRTTTFEVRGGVYETAPISVFTSARKYWALETPKSLEIGLRSLFDITDELASDKVVPHFVNPLAAAIASRS